MSSGVWRRVSRMSSARRRCGRWCRVETCWSRPSARFFAGARRRSRPRSTPARSTSIRAESRRSSAACSRTTARGLQRTGASLLTAFGYDWVPGNLAGALALDEAGEAATRVQIGYFGQGEAGSSGGTQASLIGAVLEPSFAFRDGRLRTERIGARVRRFDLGDSRSAARDQRWWIRAPHAACPAPAAPGSGRSARQAGAYVRFMPFISARDRRRSHAATGARRAPDVLRRRMKGSTGGPDEARAQPHQLDRPRDGLRGRRSRAEHGQARRRQQLHVWFRHARVGGQHRSARETSARPARSDPSRRSD